MSTVVSFICLGPSFQKMSHHFLLHGLLRPTNLEKNLKPCKGDIISPNPLPNEIGGGINMGESLNTVLV